MDIDNIKELAKTVAESLNLKDFKGDIVGVKVVVFPRALEGIGYGPIDVVQRKSLAYPYDVARGHAGDPEIPQHHLDVVAMLWYRTAREPEPQGFVCGDALHLKRQELALRLVDGEYADALRLDPLEPQQFPVSVLQYHSYAPFPSRVHYTKQLCLTRTILYLSAVFCPSSCHSQK